MDRSKIEKIVKALDVGKMRRYLYDLACDAEDDICDILLHGHPGYIHLDSEEIIDEMIETVMSEDDDDSVDETIEIVDAIDNPIKED